MPELGTYVVTILLRAQEKISQAVNKATSAMKKMQKSATGLSKTFKRIRETMTGVFLGMVGFEIFDKVTTAIYDSIQAFREFEEQSVKLASVTADSWQSIGLVAAYYRAEASAAAREFGISAGEALDALEALMKAGLKGSEAARALGAAIKMARLEGVDFATAANNLVQVMAQFGITGAEAERVVDALVNASRLGIGTANDFAQGLANCGASARALGMNLEDATAWLVVLERRFGSAQEAGTHLNRFFLELYEIAEKLGVPIRDVNGNLRNTNDIIKDVIARARALGGDFKTLQDRLTGTDMRAQKTLFTFTQMREEIDLLIEDIKRMNVAWEAYQNWLKTSAGQTAQLGAEWDRLERRMGVVWSDIEIGAKKAGIGIYEFLVLPFQHLGAIINRDVIGQIEVLMEREIMLGKMSSEEAAKLIADWTKAGKAVFQLNGITYEYNFTLQDALRLSERLGVMSDELRAIIGDTAKTLDIYFRQLRESGQLTREVFEGTIAAALMQGELSKEQAEKLAKKYGFLDDKLQSLIDRFVKLGEEMNNAQSGARITAEAIIDLAKKFKLNEDRAIDLANQILGLNLTYDEHDQIVKQLMESYGLTEEQARKLIEAMEREAEAAKRAEEAQKAHEEALKKLQTALGKVADYGKVLGPFHDAIQDISDTIKTLGSEAPAGIRGLLSDLQALNQQFVVLEERSRAVAAAQNVASTAMSYFTTIQEIQEALMADEIAATEEHLRQLEEKLKKLRESKTATEEQIQAVQAEIEATKQQLETMKQSTALTIEQTLSQKRLAAIQQMLAFTSQIVSLQQTAMQLAMMGAGDAASGLMDAIYLLIDAQADGIVTEEEMRNILEKLSVTFDETGKPVINLKDIMEEFRKKVEETRGKVQDFRSTLASLDGMTVHTYHYHHEIIVKGTKTAGGGGAKEEAPRSFDYAPGAQHGAWYTREGLYYVHRGEMILPRSVAEWFRRGGGVAASQKIVNIRIGDIIVNAGWVRDIDELVEVIDRKLLEKLRMAML